MTMDIKELRRLRTLLYDAYWPPFSPDMHFSALRGAELCAAAHADSVRFGSIGKYAFYPSSVYPRHPQLGDRDFLQEMIDTGVKVVCYIPVGHGVPRSWVSELYPDWVCRNDAGEMLPPRGQEYHFGAEPLLSICSFGRYESQILTVVDEILEYDVSAVYLDGPYQGWGTEYNICQCEACQERYLRETGRPLPKNSETERWDEYQVWKRGHLLELLRKIRQKTSAKGIPLMMNRTAAGMNGETVELAMLELVDCFLIETNRGGIAGASLAHVMNKMIWNYTNAHGYHPRLTNPVFEAGTQANGRRTYAVGGSPIVSYAGRFFHDDSCIGFIRQMFEDGERVSQLGDAEYFSCVFVPSDERLHGQPTPKDSVATTITDSLCGRGIPVMELSEHFLEDERLVERFKVVFITRRIRLDERRSELLRHFVERGGTVVFTGMVPPAWSGVASGVVGERLERAFKNQRWGARRYDCYLVAGDEWLPQSESVLLTCGEGMEVLGQSVLYDTEGELRYDSVFAGRVGAGRVVVFDSPIEEWLNVGHEALETFFRGAVFTGLTVPFEITQSDEKVTVGVREDAVVLTSTRPTRCRYVLDGRTGEIDVSGLVVVQR